MIDELPVEGESQIALKYKATLEKPPNVEWFLGAELGFLAVVSHIVQLSNDGTRFDYRDEGGQDVLFPFFRLSTDLKFKGRHTIVFLYQPLKLTGETVLSQDTTFDGIVFPAGTPLKSTESMRPSVESTGATKRSRAPCLMRVFALATTSPTESRAFSIYAIWEGVPSEPRATRARRATVTPRTGSTSSRSASASSFVP